MSRVFALGFLFRVPFLMDTLGVLIVRGTFLSGVLIVQSTFLLGILIFWATLLLAALIV